MTSYEAMAYDRDRFESNTVYGYRTMRITKNHLILKRKRHKYLVTSDSDNTAKTVEKPSLSITTWKKIYNVGESKHGVKCLLWRH